MTDRTCGVDLGTEVKMPICEVCRKNQAVGVACVPGVPYSAAYCRACLEANAHPYFIVVANTACCGGLEHTHEGWQDMVRCTLAHLGKSVAQFEADVTESMRQQEDMRPPKKKRRKL